MITSIAMYYNAWGRKLLLKGNCFKRKLKTYTVYIIYTFIQRGIKLCMR